MIAPVGASVSLAFLNACLLPTSASALTWDQVPAVGASGLNPLATTVVKRFGQASGSRSPLPERSRSECGSARFRLVDRAGPGVGHDNLSHELIPAPTQVLEITRVRRRRAVH